MKDLAVIESGRWRRQERSESVRCHETPAPCCYSTSRCFRVLMTVGLFILIGIAPARGADARLVVTANVLCSVSTQFNKDREPTIIIANCPDAPGWNPRITTTNPQAGLLFISPQPKLAMSITVKTRQLYVRDRGKVQQQIVRTITVVPQ